MSARAEALVALVGAAARGEIGVSVSYRHIQGGRTALSIWCSKTGAFFWAAADEERSTEALEVGCRFTCPSCGKQHFLVGIEPAVNAGLLSWDTLPDHAIASVGDSRALTDIDRFARDERLRS